MDLTTIGLACLAFLVGLAGQGIVDYQLAQRVTIPRVRKDCDELVKAELAKLREDLKPGTWKGADPTDAANRRWVKAQEKEATRAAARSQIATKVLELWGPEKSPLAMQWLHSTGIKQTYDDAVDAGELWPSVLMPLLNTATKHWRNRDGGGHVPTYNDPTRET